MEGGREEGRCTRSDGGALMASPLPTHLPQEAMQICEEVDEPTEQTISTAVEAGRLRAARLHAQDDRAFDCDKSVWPSGVKPSQREAAWQRKEMSTVMRGVAINALPTCCDGFELSFKKPLICLRAGTTESSAAASLRTRPNVYNYVVHGAKVRSSITPTALSPPPPPLHTPHPHMHNACEAGFTTRPQLTRA